MPTMIIVEKSGKSRTTKKEDRAVLGSGGMVVGGYTDFGVSTSAVGASPSKPLRDTALESAMAVRPHEVLSNWRPIMEAVPQWKHFLKAEPRVQQVYVLDCGAGGDCLFHVLAAGINQLHGGPVFSMEQMRRLAADQLCEANIAAFLFSSNPPENISKLLPAEQVARMRELINTPGHAYWGETGTLEHLLLHSAPFKQRQLGFAILAVRRRPMTNSKQESKKEMRAYTQIMRLESTKHLLFLYNDVDQLGRPVHWLLVGVAPNPKIKTVASTYPIADYPAPLFSFLCEPNDSP